MKSKDIAGFKTETVEQFLSRGGKINKISRRAALKHFKGSKPTKSVPEIDYSALPKALQIKLGV